MILSETENPITVKINKSVFAVTCVLSKNSVTTPCDCGKCEVKTKKVVRVIDIMADGFKHVPLDSEDGIIISAIFILMVFVGKKCPECGTARGKKTEWRI